MQDQLCSHWAGASQVCGGQVGRRGAPAGVPWWTCTHVCKLHSLLPPVQFLGQAGWLHRFMSHSDLGQRPAGLLHLGRPAVCVQECCAATPSAMMRCHLKWRRLLSVPAPIMGSDCCCARRPGRRHVTASTPSHMWPADARCHAQQPAHLKQSSAWCMVSKIDNARVQAPHRHKPTTSTGCAGKDTL